MNTLRIKKPVILEKVKVIKRIELTSDLWIMWLERPEEFTFKPGKYCTIGLEGIERAYSIASAPHEEFIELFLERIPKPQGMLTPLLWELAVGDSVSIRPRSKGVFTLDPSLPNQLFIGTVTGVAPYVSFIRDYLHHRRDGLKFHILMGASYCDEFVYDRELLALSRQHPGLVTFIPTVSQPVAERNSAWTGETGRVNLLVEDYVNKLGFKPEDTLIYACGHPDMIEDVKVKVTPRGFNVKHERFWK